jgi:hypothetical protein
MEAWLPWLLFPHASVIINFVLGAAAGRSTHTLLTRPGVLALVIVPVGILYAHCAFRRLHAKYRHQQGMERATCAKLSTAPGVVGNPESNWLITLL